MLSVADHIIDKQKIADNNENLALVPLLHQLFPNTVYYRYISNLCLLFHKVENGCNDECVEEFKNAVQGGVGVHLEKNVFAE